MLSRVSRLSISRPQQAVAAGGRGLRSASAPRYSGISKGPAAAAARSAGLPLSQTRDFSLSRSALAGVQTFNRLVNKHHNWQQQKVSLEVMMEDLRMLQGLEVAIGKEATDASVEYRDAERALFALSVAKTDAQVSLADILTVLPDDNGRAWTAIFDRAFKGEVTRLTDYNDESLAAALFCRIYNVGGKRAAKFTDAGARTFKDLERLDQEGTISLQKAQKLGIQYFHEIEKLIPREEIEAFEPKLLAAVQDADPQIKVEILGSYRRGNKFSSDVDIVATHPDLKRGADEKEVKAVLTKLVEAAQKHGIIIATLADGKHVYRGLGRLAEGGATRRIDFTVTSYDGFAYRVLGFTGDDQLMKIMRKRAKDQKLFLNTEGMGPRVPSKTAEIWDYERPILAESEEDIFKALKMDYLAPEQRNFKDYKDKIDTRTK